MYTSVSPPFRSPPSPLSLSLSLRVRARALSTPGTAMLLVKTCLFINRFDGAIMLWPLGTQYPSGHFSRSYQNYLINLASFLGRGRGCAF